MATAALFTKMSIRPNSAMALLIKRSTSWVTPTSHFTARMLTPLLVILSAPSAAFVSSISAINTVAPSFAKASLIASPMPLAAPVTMATLFFNLMMNGCGFFI